MLKSAIETLVNLKDNKIYKIEGKDYSDNPLNLIEPPRYKPRNIEVSGISSIVNLIKTEIEKLNAPLFVEVDAFNKIAVYSTYDERFERQSLYTAVSDTPHFQFGWKEYNEAMIAFRSQFEQGEDIEYILNLLGSITDENTVKNEDNGLAQTVEVRKGIGMKGKENIRPIVKLRPYRTFKEIKQPESQFLLRLNDKGEIGLFEADGGMWKLEAKKGIAYELEWQLKDLIFAEKVIVMY